jgi:type IV secretory pathway TrbD component
MFSPEAPDGFTSIVHQGPLKPVLIWRAPHEYVVINALVAMMVMLTLTWRWAVVAALVHVALILAWMYDPHFLPGLFRSLLHRLWYGTE